MTRKPAPASNLRNGLKWRDGRPYWEPSPANRACGFRGMVLKTGAGDWMDRGAATQAADARTLWAGIVRSAMRDDVEGGKARAMLRGALERLSPHPTDPHLRSLVMDLIERGRALLEDREPEITVALTRAPRTVEALREGFLGDTRAMGELAIKSRAAYKTQSKKLVLRFPGRRVETITRPELREWYLDLCEEISISSANQIIGVAGAMLRWATWQTPAWIESNPCSDLGTKKAPGRRVFWEFDEEKALIPWWDANGFVDVADCAITCLWTGARQVDVATADIPDLLGDTWRYVPSKTKKNGQEALPGLLPAVKQRVERRQREAASDRVRQLNSAPFLWSVHFQRRHTSQSIGDRFREARAAAVAAGVVAPSFMFKRLQDTRDTCVTRLFDAGVEISKIPPWTGHSGKDRDDILRDHYLSLREHGQLQTARKLESYAAANGYDWAVA